MFHIKQYDHVTLLGVTFQSNCEFSGHVKSKLCEAKRIKERGLWAERFLPSIYINCAL